MTVNDFVSLKSENENPVNETEISNIWSDILQEVQDLTKATPPKLIILLGDNESGRTTLVSRLKGVENVRKGIGLEYHYIDIKDEDRDEIPKLSVWIPDGDGSCANLLKFALNEQNFEHTLVVFVVSMSTPWSIMDSLKKWSTLLTEHINKLNISEAKRDEYRRKQCRMFQTYQDPDEHLNMGGASSKKSNTKTAKQNETSVANVEVEDHMLLPLDQSILNRNLGLPIIVIATKSDSISILDKEMEYRIEHFDFIQYHIRRFCLNYGAALFYTTVKEKRTFDRLYKYVLHRLYGYPFTFPSNVVDRESIFIPTGWDNEGKMNILLENSATIKSDSDFGEIIPKPTIRKSMPREVETVLASEDQEFLSKLQVLLNKSALTTKADEMNSLPSISPQNTTPPGIKAQHKPPMHKGASQTGTDSTNLKNFFQNLLNKNTPSTPANLTSPAVSTGESSSATGSPVAPNQQTTSVNLNTPNPNDSTA